MRRKIAPLVAAFSALGMTIAHAFKVDIAHIGRDLNDLGAARIAVDDTLNNSGLPVLSASHDCIGGALARDFNKFDRNASFKVLLFRPSQTVRHA